MKHFPSFFPADTCRRRSKCQAFISNHYHSLVLQQKESTLQDDFGNVRTIIVSDQTMQNVKAVIEAGDKNPTPALYPQQQTYPIASPTAPQSSMGSLPSAHSYYGSTSSFGLNFSQQSGVNPMVQR